MLSMFQIQVQHLGFGGLLSGKGEQLTGEIGQTLGFSISTTK